MMRLAPRGVIVFITTLLGASHICSAQSLPPSNGADCKRTVNKQEFESRNDGPFVTNIGYSRVLHSCVLIRVQGFPWKGDFVHLTTDIFDVGDNRTIWSNGRIVQEGNNANSRYPALAQEIKKLDIEFALR
jgi:hypothetical protein